MMGARLTTAIAFVALALGASTPVMAAPMASGPLACTGGAREMWGIVSSPNVGTADNQLSAVRASSQSNAWAVGSYATTAPTPVRQTLTEHWNGAKWAVVSSPNSGTGDNFLMGVAVPSATNAWAVGSSSDKTLNQSTLIEHWNGTAWSIVTSLNPGTDHNFLGGIAAVSANNIWAVGGYDSAGGPRQTLIEHWNGIAWTQVPSPNVGTSNNWLSSVAVVSASNAWAVGASSVAQIPGRRITTSWAAWRG
jgi:hypothetical protein